MEEDMKEMEVYLRQQEEGFSKHCSGLRIDNINFDMVDSDSRHMICPSFSFTSNGEKYKSVECCFCGQHKREEWGMKFV